MGGKHKQAQRIKNNARVCRVVLFFCKNINLSMLFRMFYSRQAAVVVPSYWVLLFRNL